jgi:bifunctional non-homologous end joining protein LigD
MKIEQYDVELSSTDKIMFPESGITKGDLIDYYHRMADVMLPHLEGRPVSLQRFPQGIQKNGFYQKEAPDYFPEWVRRIRVELKDDEMGQEQVVIENAASLVYLAQQNTITLHSWLSRTKLEGNDQQEQDLDAVDAALQYPDRLILDLDPPEDNFDLVRPAAWLVHEVLLKLEIQPFLMTTGGRGLHVVAALDGSADFDESKAFARDLAEYIAARKPDHLTTEQRIEARQGRLFIDYLRNAYAQTGVTPYSVRAKEGAPVATPIDWDELNRKGLHARSYNIRNIFKRLGQKRDPWADIDKAAANIADARAMLDRLDRPPI